MITDEAVLSALKKHQRPTVTDAESTAAWKGIYAQIERQTLEEFRAQDQLIRQLREKLRNTPKSDPAHKALSDQIELHQKQKVEVGGASAYFQNIRMLRSGPAMFGTPNEWPLVRDAEIVRLQQKIASLERENSSLKDHLEKKNQEIAAYKVAIEELRKIIAEQEEEDDEN